MAVTKYTYAKIVDPARLELELKASPDILVGLSYIHVIGSSSDVYMKAALPGPEETALDALVAAHVPTPLPDAPRVVKLDGESGPSGESRVWVQPNREHFFMCDRDFLMKTAVIGAGSFQDLRVNVDDMTETEWGEMSQVGVYKLDGGGGYTPCVDQADATANARLSVWDYLPKMQDGSGDVIPLDFRGGRLFVDPNLTFFTLSDYRLYAIMAPNIPAAYGGRTPFFDGYLARADGGIVDSVNPTAVSISVDQSTEAVRLRLFIYYPAGVTVTTHVLQLVTYRPIGSW